ncbi:MAG: hypothetical protein RL219_195 [Actinomycetota bacterium]
MATAVTYVKGAELPPLLVQMLDENNDVIDFTSASGFSFKLALDTSTTTLTKTTGITGSTTGATIAWATNDLNIAAGRYLAELTATVSGLDYRRQFVIQIDPNLA